jgi:hypothetical protein
MFEMCIWNQRPIDFGMDYEKLTLTDNFCSCWYRTFSKWCFKCFKKIKENYYGNTQYYKKLQTICFNKKELNKYEELRKKNGWRKILPINNKTNERQIIGLKK